MDVKNVLKTALKKLILLYVKIKIQKAIAISAYKEPTLFASRSISNTPTLQSILRIHSH